MKRDGTIAHGVTTIASPRDLQNKKKPHVFKKREVLYNMERIAAKGCNPQVYISKRLTNVT